LQCPRGTSTHASRVFSGQCFSAASSRLGPFAGVGTARGVVPLLSVSLSRHPFPPSSIPQLVVLATDSVRFFGPPLNPDGLFRTSSGLVIAGELCRAGFFFFPVLSFFFSQADGFSWSPLLLFFRMGSPLFGKDPRFSLTFCELRWLVFEAELPLWFRLTPVGRAPSPLITNKLFQDHGLSRWERIFRPYIVGFLEFFVRIRTSPSMFSSFPCFFRGGFFFWAPVGFFGE